MQVREVSIPAELRVARERIAVLEADLAGLLADHVAAVEALRRVVAVVTAPSYLVRGQREPRFVLHGREVIAALEGA